VTVEQHQGHSEHIRDIAEKKAVVLVESYLKKIHYAFEAGFRNSGFAGANMAINEIRQPDIAEIYKELYTKVGLYIAKEEYAFNQKHLKRSGFEFFDEVWNQYILRAIQDIEITKRITKVTETTKLAYRQLLSEAASSRFAPREIARLFVSKRITFIRQRALTIARTEMTYAASLGTEYAADAYESQIGVPMFKVWYHNASRDFRAAHAAISRTYKRRNELFIVNGIGMDKPGDPKGGANECINCRCCHKYATEDVLKEIGLWKGN
jgi:hypothetical protein